MLDKTTDLHMAATIRYAVQHRHAPRCPKCQGERTSDRPDEARRTCRACGYVGWASEFAPGARQCEVCRSPRELHEILCATCQVAADKEFADREEAATKAAGVTT